MILRINYNLASCVQHQIYKRCFQQEKKQLVIFSPGSAKNSLEITNVSMQWWLTFWKFAEWNAEVYSTACQSVWRSMAKTLPSHLQKHSCTGLRCSRSIFISVEIISDSKQNYFDLNAKCKKKKNYSPTFSIFCRLSWFNLSKHTCPPKPPPPALQEEARGASWATCSSCAPNGTHPNATPSRHPNQMPKPTRLEAKWPQTDSK